jgi:hypothetical protein
MINARRSFLLACLAAPASASEVEVGPFCWAGRDSNGQDKFIPCHPRQETTLVLDPTSFGGLRIIFGSHKISVSREQLLKALEGWEAESRAKP